MNFNSFLSNIAAIDTNKLKNEFKELFPLKSTDQLDKFMQTMKSSLNKAQEYLDLLYKVLSKNKVIIHLFLFVAHIYI